VTVPVPAAMGGGGTSCFASSGGRVTAW
jgi:hypothetical protein